jgi:hypothetical protein
MLLLTFCSPQLLIVTSIFNGIIVAVIVVVNIKTPLFFIFLFFLIFLRVTCAHFVGGLWPVKFARK